MVAIALNDERVVLLGYCTRAALAPMRLLKHPDYTQNAPGRYFKCKGLFTAPTGTFAELVEQCNLSSQGDRTLNDVPYYLELQRRMFDIFRYVSCHDKNFQTHSVAMEALLVTAASLFDSQCQTFIREKSVIARHTFKREGEVQNFKKKVEGRENFNCGDYRVLLEGDCTLSKNTVNLNPYEDSMIVNPLSYAPDKINKYLIAPFQEWAADKSPGWWTAFTDLKHDRLKHHKDATLINTIKALAAAFVILTLQNEADFKNGHISPELYDLFFPQYWKWQGRIAVMSYLWQ